PNTMGAPSRSTKRKIAKTKTMALMPDRRTRISIPRSAASSQRLRRARDAVTLPPWGAEGVGAAAVPGGGASPALDSLWPSFFITLASNVWSLLVVFFPGGCDLLERAGGDGGGHFFSSGT